MQIIRSGLKAVFKKNTSLFAALFCFVTGIVLWGGFSTVMQATNTLKYCISRHEMRSTMDCHQGIAHMMLVAEAVAAEAQPELDMDYAEEIYETCAGCHGEFGEGTIDGEYPRLAGLDAAYLAKQLRNFKTRERLNIPMFPYATERELPEEDVVLIANFLSRIELPTKLPPIDENDFDALARLEQGARVVNIARYPGNIEAGRRFYRKECGSCHGRNAEGDDTGLVPPLAGQHSNYLMRQISKFRKAERVHDDPDDAEIFNAISDSEIGDMLAYLSVLDDG